MNRTQKLSAIPTFHDMNQAKRLRRFIGSPHDAPWYVLVFILMADRITLQQASMLIKKLSPLQQVLMDRWLERNKG